MEISHSNMGESPKTGRMAMDVPTQKPFKGQKEKRGNTRNGQRTEEKKRNDK